MKSKSLITLPLFALLAAAALFSPRIAESQGNERRFTGVPPWLSPDSGYRPMRAGEKITGGVIKESSAELLLNERTGAVTVMVRKVADLNISYTGCVQTEAITISLTGTYNQVTRRINAVPGKSREVRDYKIYSAPDPSKCSRSGVIPISDWWAEFEDDKTIGIYTNLTYPEKTVAVIRVTSGDPGLKKDCDRLFEQAKRFTDGIPELRARITQWQKEFEETFGASPERNRRARLISQEIDRAESDLNNLHNQRQDLVLELAKLNCYEVLKSLPEYNRRKTKVLAVSGYSFVLGYGSAQNLDVKAGDELPFNYHVLPADQRRQGVPNELTLVLPDGSLVVIKENTRMEDLYYNMMLNDGEIRASIKPPPPTPVTPDHCDTCKHEFTVRTPNATVRSKRHWVTRHHASSQDQGADFIVRYDPQAKVTSVAVTKGQITVVPVDPSIELVAVSANQHVEIGGAGSTSVATTTTTSGPGTTPSTNSGSVVRESFAWARVGPGDCGANDIGQTTGSAVPAANACNIAKIGTIAVCWDGVNYKNPSQSGQWCTYKSRAANPCRGGGNPGFVYECRAGAVRQPIDDVQLASGLSVSTQKPAYATTEKIVVQYSGLPGNPKDWISVVAVGSPDSGFVDTQWGYTQGNKQGTFEVGPLPAGKYEARVYFNWGGPEGYRVQARSTFEVVARTVIADLEASARGFAGTWETGGAWGDLLIQQRGAQVSGSYTCCGGGTFRGTASGKTASFTWTRSDGASGEAVISIKPDGTLEGKWCFGASCDPTQGSPFAGKRM